MELRSVFVLVLAACSSAKPKSVDDARKPVPDPVAAIDAGAVHGYRVDTAVKKGDVQIRVEWKNVPVEMRTSPGRSECGTALPAAVAPTTTWGIPDVFVAIEVDHGKAMPALEPRLVVERCTIVPRVVLAGAEVVIASAVEQPISVAVSVAGLLPLGSATGAGAARDVRLPIAGHEVAVPLEPGTSYAVKTVADAFVVAAPTPYYAITEATGTSVLREVPIGTHVVRAWLPPRARQPGRAVQGSVSVTAGALAEITLDLAP